MSEKGKPSTAHVFDNAGCCIHCQMYRVNVNRLNHECTPEQEAIEDAKVKKNGK